MQTMVKKAQMKIQQMAFVLIAITLFFVLVGMLVLAFRFAGLKESSTELQEENAEALVIKLANSPEFSCWNAYDYGTAVCIDGDKLMALASNAEKYKGFWSVDNIEVRKIYPDKGNTICTGSNYPDCGIITINNGFIQGVYVSNFVVLCRKQSVSGETYDKCELAKLLVSYKPTG